MSLHRNIITNYSQQDATFLEFIYFYRRSTCFRRFLRPSSGALNCTYSLTFRLLMSYIYGAHVLDVSRSHTTTHHSRQDSSGRVISSSQRPLPDNIRHSQQTNIHAPGGIRTHDLSRWAAAGYQVYQAKTEISRYTRLRWEVPRYTRLRLEVPRYTRLRWEVPRYTRLSRKTPWYQELRT